MQQILKKMSLILGATICALIMSFGFLGATANASNIEAVCNGVQIAGGANCADLGTDNDTTSSSIDHVVSTVVNILSWIVGIVAVIMVIIGGLFFVISSGDSTKTAKARNTIIYALVGLVIVALAQIIVHFVLKTIK